MKKILIFFLIIIGWLFYINIYEYNSLKKNIKPFFFLYLRAHPEFQNISLSNIFFPEYNIKNIADVNFYIKDVKYNPLLNKVKISHIIITDKVIEQLKEIIKNFDYINGKFKIIKFNNVEILLNNNDKLKFLYGILLHKAKQKKFLFKFKGYYKKIYFDLTGKLDKNGKIFYNVKFDSVPAKILFFNFLKLPKINILNLNKLIKGKLDFYGKYDNITKVNFNGTLDNNTLLNFSILKKDKFYLFQNGIINFNSSNEENGINFKGKILSQSNWNFIFYSKSNNLNIPVNNSTLKFKEIDFSYAINYSDDEKLNILKLSAIQMNIDNRSYSFIKKFFSKKNYLYSIYIDNVVYDNLTVRNLDIHVSDSNGSKSIEKFNFDIDSGKVLYSYILRDDKFQWAINIKNLDIDKAIKFLFNKNININGKLKLNFLASGKNKKFLLGNGLLSGKDFILKGISNKQLEKVFTEGDIVNLGIIEDNSLGLANDNITIISKLSSLISVKDSSIILRNLLMDFTLFKLKLKGEIDINNFNNIIMEGRYISKINPSKDVIININLKDKFIQFIGK